MSNSIKSILFAVIMSVICGSLLTLASTGLKEYQLKNIALDKQKNILKSVGLVDENKEYTGKTIAKLFSKNIKKTWVDFEGNLVSGQKKDKHDQPVYLFVKNRKIKEYIIPLQSRGLWGKISGYLAMKSDGETVAGFTVYHHSETPGLGGEIERSWFQNNFKGKKILDNKKRFVSVKIAKGRIPANQRKNYVDGISGATLTGKFLSGGIKKTLIKYETLSRRFRKNKIK